MRKIIILIFVLIICVAFQSCSVSKNVLQPETFKNSGHDWAKKIDKSGLPNLYKVSDSYFRGAQPTQEGFKELKKMGVKTIINLRAFHSDENLIEDSSFINERIYFKTWNAENEDVIKFIKIVSDPAKQPVFVHCLHGADRTGVMTAIYRVINCGWNKDEALSEMVYGGFGYHPIWTNLLDFFIKLDIEKTKEEVKK